MTTRVVSAADVDLRLLLVEDDGTYASYIGATLMSVFSAHFQYDHVTSIGAAVERLSDAAYDLVLLDLGLPDAAGLDGLSTVVGVAPDIPVIILSGAEDGALALPRSKQARRTTCQKATRREKCSHGASGTRSSGSTPSFRSSAWRTVTASRSCRIARC